MRAPDIGEPPVPRAALIFHLNPHPALDAHHDPDLESATRPPAGTVRTGVGRQFTHEQHGVIRARVIFQEASDKGPRPTHLIHTASKTKGASAKRHLHDTFRRHHKALTDRLLIDAHQNVAPASTFVRVTSWIAGRP